MYTCMDIVVENKQNSVKVPHRVWKHLVSINASGGGSLRYQKGSFICSASGEFGYYLSMIFDKVKNLNEPQDQITKGKERANIPVVCIRATAGYQLRRHGIAGYIQMQEAIYLNGNKDSFHYLGSSAIGVEYSYLFGQSFLLQSRVGFKMVAQSMFSTGQFVGGVDVGVNVAYKLC